MTRTLAPLGRRLSEIVSRDRFGAYVVLSADDPDGPAPDPGQFYMLAAAERWGGGEDERPFLPRAFSVLRRHEDGTLEFLLEDVGPGTQRLAELRPGDGLWLLGPLGNGFAPPRDGRRPVLVGGGVGTAPLAIWSDALGDEAVVLLGFRDKRHAAGAELIEGARVATDDGAVGHHGLVTDLLRAELDMDFALPSPAPQAPRSTSGRRYNEVYACGPPPMLEAVRAMCAERGVPAQLALEAGMACGFGACFGCVVPTRDGYVRLCVDGPVLDAGTLDRVEHPMIDFCGIELAHPIVNGSGTFDAIAARRAFGDALLDRFPFAAFVSKTVTVAPREGNPPPRLYEVPGGLINSIGLPNKGLDGYLAHDLPELAALPVPLIVNVMGFAREEVARLVAAFGERDEVAALELNVSCPNVKTGMIMGADPAETGALLDAVRPHTDKPLIVKLTPNCASPADVAAAAEAHGADAVSLINTLRGMAMHPRRAGTPWLGGGTGGVSGAAVRAMALVQIAEVSGRVDIPVVGMGGVQTGRHARDVLDAGATLVGVGTESFRDPLAGVRIAAELEQIRPAPDVTAAAAGSPSNP